MSYRNIDHNRYHFWRSCFFLVVLGVAFGALNSACNHGLGSAYAAKLIGNDWGWLAAGLVACWAGRSWKSAFGRGVAFLIPAVLAYYITDSLAGVYTTIDVNDPTVPARFSLSGALADSFFYIVLGSLTAAGLALLVVLVHRGGSLGILASLAMPSYITWDAWQTRSFLSHDRPNRDPVLLQVVDILWQASLGVTVAVLLIQLWRLRSNSGSSHLDSRIAVVPGSEPRIETSATG